MKNNIMYKGILMVLAMVGAFGCSDDFLDTELLTGVTDESFYRTIEDADIALIGCYDGVQQIYNNGVSFPLASEIFSDNCYGGTGNTDAFNYRVMDEFSLAVDPGQTNVFNSSWVAYYQAIYRINVLLEKMDNIDWSNNPDYRNEVEAQARFLRAYCYFDMVRLWERIPLVTVPSSGNLPQNDADEIYTQIAEDLSFAAANGGTTVSPGRINQHAAKALLARVYLFYTGYYGASDLVGMVTGADALQGLEDVIASGSYGLVSDFRNLWPAASSSPDVANNTLTSTYAGPDNPETVFSIKYNITSNYNGDNDGNHWLVLFGMRGHEFSPYGRGWGAGTVLSSFYDAFDDTDVRRDASIIAIDEEGLDFDPSDQREYTGYTNKKYLPLSLPDGSDVATANGASDFQIGQYQDYVAIRYADVLLMAAELGSASAESYFDMVRDRSNPDNPRDATLANILEERRLEFAFEGLRYWDLLRQGVDVAANTIAVNTTVLNGGNSESKVISAADIVATRGLRRIPQNQITRSDGLLTQNEGW